MAHFVYILQSLRDHKYYIGETRDVEARVRFHNAGLQRSTRARVPFILILVEEYETRMEVLVREKQIKAWKGGNAFIRLISGN